MEKVYCYTCRQSQNVERDDPRSDWDDYGWVEITDLICCKCKSRSRLVKRFLDKDIKIWEDRSKKS
ncbi:hypothetical protein J2Z37_004359 [Ammoniphilus resinae]|uniref:Uncharacterized protein n=1 Tax=Ammoniphilus resinae TaxID=861532 RepID=A0ABS4GVN3_9BACL|nr:hypothetical protein [Ammoniphilus resinae]